MDAVGGHRVSSHGGPFWERVGRACGGGGQPLSAQPGVTVPVENTTAFVCGPPVMFRFVIRDLSAMGFSQEQIVSTLERYMKCGVGKCGHCCIGVAYVCLDGPVLTYGQIRRLGEDI
jgi:sulfhydrogenase subunit gamma (sulfur reductase)